MEKQTTRALDKDLFTPHELETIFHVFSNKAQYETNQEKMLQYEKIASFAINERGRIAPNFIKDNYF